MCSEAGVPTVARVLESAAGGDRQTVAGAAIIRHARVLAARRVHPPELAGGWELPGGKVDPGEAPETACVREVREELGCDVRVVRRLPDELSLGGGWTMVVFECALVAGEPVPTEHDVIRWLGPEDLDDVPWLPADRPLLGPLRQRLLDGECLVGGNVGGAVRIGMTVRRPTGPWTPAVHSLLEHLRAAGVFDVPRVLGPDERGREVLSWLPGRVVDVDTEHITDDFLVDGMRWLRRYHQAVRGFRPQGVVRWRNHERALADDEVVCHHDFAPYNVAEQDDRVVGVFDWDMAGPGTPMEDVAFAAWNFVPLWRDLGPVETARRLRLLCDAYGGMGPVEVLPMVVTRITAATDRIRVGQKAGDPGMLNLARVGEPDRTLRALRDLRGRAPAILAALG